MSETSDISKRIEYIDIAKGIGILLVVFGHVVWGGNYPMPHAGFISNLIYSFHMPLFFIISGMCIKESKVLDKQTVRKMALAYLIPYAIWTILYLLMFQTAGMLRGQESIFNFKNNLFAHAISICGVAPLWFLIALFIAEVMTIAIKPLLRNRGGTTEY